MFDNSFALKSAGLEPLTDKSGVRAAKPVRFDIPEGFLKRPWAAKWIWLDPARHPGLQKTEVPGNSLAGKAVVAFKREFAFESAFGRTLLRLAADRKYRLFINGEFAGRGPAELGGDYDWKLYSNWRYFDSIDISSFLKPGVNSVFVEVALCTRVFSDFSCGQGGLLVEAASFSGGEWRTLFASDASWPCSLLREHVEPNVYDARLEKTSTWEPCGFPPASTLGQLYPSRLPQMLEAELEPASCPAELLVADGASVKLDFGRVFSGFLCLELDAPEGSALTAEHFETADGVKPHRTEVFISKGARQLYRSFNMASMRFVKLSAKGGSFKLKRPRAVFSSYPVAWLGSFDCSDPELSKFWELGRHATQICMQTLHWDSPLHQEPLGCTGDYMIEAAINYVCFGETALAALDVERTARLLRARDWKMFHTSYSLLWVVMLKDLYMRTGDLELLRRFQPELEALLDAFLSWRGSNGLVTEAPSFMFMDWLKMDGFSLHHPPCVVGQGYLSAFLLRALNEAVFMANELCEPAWSARLSASAEELKAAFKKALWNPSRKLFRDGVPFVRKAPTDNLFMPADRDVETFTPHTNIAAVIAGVVEGEEAKELLRRVMNDASLIEPQPYFHHFTFEALEKTGLFGEFGLPLMKRWNRMLADGANTWRESWDMGDWSHAWCGTPTLQLSRNVAGVKPLKPGCSEIELSPCLCGLESLACSVPLPQGVLSVRLERRGAVCRVSLKTPPGCSVSIPALGCALEGSPTEWTESSFELPA